MMFLKSIHDAIMRMIESRLPFHQPLLIVGIVAFTKGLIGCIPPHVPDPMALYQDYRVPYQMPEDRGQVAVKVSLGEQRAYVLEGNRVLLVMPVTVGKSGHVTPTGHFTIQKKSANYRSPTYGFAIKGDEVRRARFDEVPEGWQYVGMPLPYWSEILPGVGFHTGWLRHQPASHRTIRMHQNLAPVFDSMVDVGTPVHIAQSHAEDLNYGLIPLPPDSGPIPPLPDRYYLGDDFFQAGVSIGRE